MSDIPPAPTTPTDARPGSAEKLAVMTARHEAGLQLHHALDANCRIDPSELNAPFFRFGDCLREPADVGGFE